MVTSQVITSACFLLGLLAYGSFSLPTGPFAGQDSCAGRCNKSGVDPIYDCQCNTACLRFDDCCEDYRTLCLGTEPPPASCDGRCGASLNSSWPCQCNDACASFGDCCPDYASECGGGGNPEPVSDAEIVALTEALHSAEDTNNAAQYVTLDLQGRTNEGSNQDLAPLPLLTVQPEALQKPTIQLLTKLYDNYIAEVDRDEVITEEERQEEDDFLNAIFATPVFQQARSFLIQKKFLTEENFREKFYQIWFGQYSRASGRVGSSGFEHVFMGEIKNGVSGFHNWVYFHDQEKSNDMNYHGYLEFGSFGDKGSLVAHNFNWRNNQKPISSMFVGTSPELELALFTICWYSRPNAKCTVQLHGVKFYVQTYDISYNGNKFVASSYADVSI